MLSKTEKKFISGQLSISKEYENKLRYTIKKKIESAQKDLTLILENLDFCNSNRHIVDDNIPYLLKNMQSDLNDYNINLESKLISYYGYSDYKSNWKITKKSNS